MSEAFVKCPKCGEKMQLTLTPMPEQPAEKRFVKTEKQIQAEAVSEPKVELDVEAVDWKPWKEATGGSGRVDIPEAYSVNAPAVVIERVLW
jgi:hypothetical protein